MLLINAPAGAPFRPGTDLAGWSRPVLALVFVILALVSGCAPSMGLLAGPAPKQSQELVPLHGYDLGVHLAAKGRRSSPLIIYATGDTGWRDKDKALFRTLTTWGYPVAGVSAPEYVDHLGDDADTLCAEDVARDFDKIVETAEANFGLPTSTPIVLVGVSRGAGLAVAAGTASRLSDRLVGILAIALTREEENVGARPQRTAEETSEDASMDSELAPLETYRCLPSLGDTRVAVVQSTHDEYVPAEEARELFGPDTSSRRLRAVASENHSFDGASRALNRELKRSFDWIVKR
jgi:hypothetical protein